MIAMHIDRVHARRVRAIPAPAVGQYTTGGRGYVATSDALRLVRQIATEDAELLSRLAHE